MARRNIAADSTAKPSRWPRALIALVTFQLLWRFVCFWWLPINLQGFPGALIESSAMAGSALLACWLVLGDQPAHGRIWIVGGLLAAARGLQDLGYLAGTLSWRRGFSPADVSVFRIVDDEVLVTSLVVALGLRWLTGCRVSRNHQLPIVNWPPRQFRLKSIFAVTAIVALALAVAKIDWFFWARGSVDRAIFQALYAHALMISLAAVFSFVVLTSRLTWLGLVLWLGCAVGLPWLLVGYCQFAGWFDEFLEPVWHFSTVIGGATASSVLTALICRLSGIRGRLRLVQPRRQLALDSTTVSWP